jgi:hypothetical protein
MIFFLFKLGYFGCIKCFHPTVRNKANTKNVYTWKEKYDLRTNTDYNREVETAVQMEKNKKLSNADKKFMGIIGFSYLSKWVTIPESIIIDLMHCCFLGSFRSIINMLFDSKNSREAFYLGLKSIPINTILH